MRSGAWTHAIAGVLSLAACGGDTRDSPGGQSSSLEWLLAESPALTIGVAEGKESDELAGASSSLRLADGRIVIANSGTSELRVFDSMGTFLESIGRKGEGPGEFTGWLQMAAISATEFAVFDQSAQRLSVFDTSGALIRESRILADQAGRGFPLWVWLYRDAWISGPIDTARRADIAGALSLLPRREAGSYLYAVIATDGRIWVQMRTTTRTPHPWGILDSRGAPLGVINLPEGKEVHQIGPDYILLRHWGSNDVEQIQMYRFEEHQVPNMASSSPLADTAMAADSTARTMMAGAMRNLVMAQETFYMDNAAYARAAGGLNWESPPGTTLHLMTADKRGWVGALVHQRRPIICGMAVGGSTPPGWSEGSPKCSR